jgi:hypothetical protein
MENAYELTLTVRMSQRYHRLCERWFLRLNKIVTFVNVFLGSAVVAASLWSVPKCPLLWGSSSPFFRRWT